MASGSVPACSLDSYISAHCAGRQGVWKGRVLECRKYFIYTATHHRQYIVHRMVELS